MTRSLHVVASLAREHGGPSYSVPRLCQALEEQGGEVALASIDHGTRADGFPARLFAQDFASIPALNRLRFSRDLRDHLAAKASKVDIVHNHGLWLAPNIYAGQAAARVATPLVVSPRGMLAAKAMRYSGLKKRVMWHLLQKPAFRSAAGWHATSEDEVNDIRTAGIERPVAVIPNGVDIPVRSAGHDPSKPVRTILFLSRVHPKKGLPDLVSAWSRLEASLPDWRIVIAGPDEEGHTAQLRRQAVSLGVERIEFAGPVFGSKREALFADADLYVLPTQSENFGIAVAEALAAGVPAIVTRGAPWAGLVENGCGWWIDHGSDPLEATLLQAIGLSPIQRREMGMAGRSWVAQNFSWSTIAARMEALYLWLLGRGDRPAFVVG